MDKNELNLKIEELKTAMHNRDFDKAVDIASTLEIKKIKDNNFLSLVADAYELTHNYKMAKKILLMAYENTNAGRHLAYRLCLVSVKNKEFDDAEEFYEDFVEMAPRDTSRYILKYKIAKAKGDSLDRLIEILEEYVSIDMEEKWAFELAKLYHFVGDEEKCVDLCDEMSLWFAEGKYVARAMELKQLYRPLTANQKKIYDDSVQKKMDDATMAEIENRQAKEIDEPVSGKKFDTMDIQAVVADGMKEVELEDDTNIHEDAGATRVAPTFGTTADMEEIWTEEAELAELEEVDFQSEQIEDEVAESRKDEIIDNADDSHNVSVPEVFENENSMDAVDEGVTENDMAVDVLQNENSVIDENVEKPLTDIKGVEDILKQLQERGILKAETVKQAVNIIDEASKCREPEIKPEVSTLERWEEDNKIIETAESEVDIESEIAEPEDIETEIAEPEDAETEITEPEDIETEIAEPEDIESEMVEPEEIMNEVEETSADTDSNKNISEAELLKAATMEVPQLDLGAEEVIVPVLDLALETPEVHIESAELESIIDTQPEIIGEDFQESGMSEDIDEDFQKNEIPENIDEDSEQADEEVEALQMDATGVLNSTKDLSVKVEIITGTDWRQQEEKSTEQEETLTEENQAENAKDMEKVDDMKKIEEIETKLTLSEEDLQAFKNYLNVEGFENNIREILESLIVDYTPNGKSENGNVIIMGEEKTGKTSLAIELIKLVNRKRGRRGRKLAKINAEAINKKGFKNLLTKLVGSDLIIDNAQNLGTMTVSEIVDACGMFTDDMLIVLEGDATQMEQFVDEAPSLKQVFNHVVQIREYNIKEWVKYGMEYANAQGYTVDELAKLAFFKAIDDFFGKNKGIAQNDVEEIVDRAIAKSKRLGRKISGIFSSNKSDEGFYILVESDFNI